MIRGPYGTEPARLEVCLLGMQGLGKPGVHALRMIEWGIFNDPHVYPLPPGETMPASWRRIQAATRSPSRVTPGMWPNGRKKRSPVMPLRRSSFIPKDLIHEAILNPPLEWYGTTMLIEPVDDQFTKYRYPVEGCSEVHMIWTDTPSWTTCWNGGNSYTQALRSPKIEFIVAQHPWLENDCTMADLILPQHQAGRAGHRGGQLQRPVPHGHVRGAVHRAPGRVHERLRDRLQGGRASGADQGIHGDRSVQEWIDLGFSTSGVQDRLSYEEFKSKGYYVVPTAEGWKRRRRSVQVL